MNKKLNYHFKILVFSNSIFSFAGGLIVPIYSIFIFKNGGGLEIAGLLYGLQFFTSLVVGLLVLRLKDRKNLGVHMVVFNYFVRGCVWLMLSFVSGLPVLVGAQILIGISESVGHPSYNALISDHLDKEAHIREWEISNLINNIVVAGGSLLGGVLTARFGFSFLFIIMWLLSWLSIPVLVWGWNRNKILN